MRSLLFVVQAFFPSILGPVRLFPYDWYETARFIFLVCVDSVSLKTMLNGPAGERFKKQPVSVSAHHCMVPYLWTAKTLICVKKIWQFKNIRIRVAVHSKATSILSENKFLKPKKKT